MQPMMMMRRICGVVLVVALSMIAFPSIGSSSEPAIRRLASMSLGQLPAPGMAFQDDLVVVGERFGFTLGRILPHAPYVEPLSSYICPASEWADVSIWGSYVFMSIEDDMPWGHVRHYDNDVETPDCNNTNFSRNDGGIRIIDISNPRWPRQVAFARIPGGSETHALVPHRGKLFIYSQVPAGDIDEQKPTNRFTILKFDPARPKQVKPASQTETFSNGCFDITVLLGDKSMAACAMWGSTWLFDISDPVNPRLLSKIEVPVKGPVGPAVVNPTAHWTSGAQFTWDGRYLVIADAANYFFERKPKPCSGSSADRVGALWFYDISDPEDPKEVGHYSPSVLGNGASTSPCSAISVAMIPTKDAERYLATVAWFDGGFNVIDFSDPTNVREVVYHRGDTERFSALWYNGRIYSASGPGDSPFRLEVFAARDVGPSQAHYFARRYSASTQIKTFRRPDGWLAAARRRTAPSLNGPTPPAGGGSQTQRGSISLRSDERATENAADQWCHGTMIRAFSWEKTDRSALQGTFMHFFDVDSSTWGENFSLRRTSGHRSVDLDIYFLVNWGSSPIRKAPLHVVETIAPGGERGRVPHYVRHAFVCSARGETIGTPTGDRLNVPVQRASFVYRAGER